jgi:GYD domain
MKQFYLVMGEFDFVGICEAPDDAVMARYVLQLGGLGFVRTKTLKAFPDTAYREIIRSLGWAAWGIGGAAQAHESYSEVISRLVELKMSDLK